MSKKNNNTVLTIAFSVNPENPAIYEFFNNDIKELKDLKIPEKPVAAQIMVTEMEENKKIKHFKQQHLFYMVGYEAEAIDVFLNPSFYNILDSQGFVEKCALEANGMMAVYETPSGRLMTCVDDEAVKVFPTSADLVDAVIEYATEFLATKGEKVKKLNK